MFSEDETVMMIKKYPTEQESHRDKIIIESSNLTTDIAATSISTVDPTVSSSTPSPSNRRSSKSTSSPSTSTATPTPSQSEGDASSGSIPNASLFSPVEESSSSTTTVTTMLDDPNPNNNSTFSSTDDVISPGIQSDPVVILDDTNTESTSNSATIIQWSSLLQSPTTDSSFSPSLPIGKSLHGLALTATVERTKSLAKYGKRCSYLLHEVSDLQEHFAQAVLRATQTFSHSANQSLPSTTVEPIAQNMQTSLISFGKQLQYVSIMIKSNISKPWEISYATTEQNVMGIFQPYMVLREKCLKARQEALVVKKRYNKLVREAKSTMNQASQLYSTQHHLKTDLQPLTYTSPAISPTQSQEEESSINTNSFLWVAGYGSDQLKLARQQPGSNRHADKLFQILDTIKTIEEDYVSLVREENQAVERVQTMEIFGLESLQKLEEERLNFSLDTLGRFVNLQLDTLDNIALVANPDACKESRSTTKHHHQELEYLTNRRRCNTDSVVVSSTTPSISSSSSSPLTPSLSSAGLPSIIGTPTTTHRFKGRSTSTVSEASGGGNTEALGSLNLPEEVAMMRDKFQQNLAKRTRRYNAIKSLYQYVEDLIAASDIFSATLRSRLAQEGYSSTDNNNNNNIISTPIGKLSDQLAVAYKRVEGPKISNCWDSIMHDLQHMSMSCSQLSQDLGQLVQGKISVVSSLERDIKSSRDNEEMRWKNLLDTAKEEGKIQARLEQISSDLARARERLNFVLAEEPQKESDERAVDMKPQYRKALGQMFSILPGGGEEAMAKMLSLKQRQEIARVNFLELEDKVSKEMILLRNATTNKSKSYALYSATINAFDDTLRKEEVDGWDIPMNILRSILTAFSNFRNMRCSNLKCVQKILDSAKLTIIVDTRAWVRKLQTKMSTRQQNYDHTSNEPFSLSSSLPEATAIRNLMTLINNDATLTNTTNALSNTSDFIVVGNSNGDAVLQGSGEVSISDEANVSPIRPNDKQMITKQSMDSVRETEKVPETSTFNVKGTEINLFLTHFREKNESEDPPTIIESYTCTHWPRFEGGGMLLPHGRMFLTSSTMFFIGWGNKKVIFNWEDVVSVEKGTTALGMMDNAIDIKCREGEKEESYFFGSFASRDSAYQLISQLVSVSKSLKDLNAVCDATSQQVLGDVPPDDTIKKMDLLFTKTLKGVSVSDFFAIVWSEEDVAQPFYLPLLLKKGNKDVIVEKWEIASSEGFVKQWCGEKYSRRRKVNYKHVRTTHLYIGPPVATVSEVHHVRTEGQNKCVFSMSVQIDGIPYGDCFAIEIRYVARRIGSCDLRIEVGCHVVMKKPCMFAKKIRAGTLTESKNAHLQVFEAIREACLKTSSSAEDEVVTEVEEVTALAEPVEDKLANFIDGLRRIMDSNILPFISDKGKTFLDLVDNHALFLGFSLIFILVLFLFLRPAEKTTSTVSDPNETLLKLSQELEKLTNEVLELKQMLHLALKNIQNPLLT